MIKLDERLRKLLTTAYLVPNPFSELDRLSLLNEEAMTTKQENQITELFHGLSQDSRFTDWEVQFIYSLYHRNRNCHLTENQIDRLDEIHGQYQQRVIAAGHMEMGLETPIEFREGIVIRISELEMKLDKLNKSFQAFRRGSQKKRTKKNPFRSDR